MVSRFKNVETTKMRFLVLVLAALQVSALNEWESLVAIKTLADQFLSADQVGSSSSLFANDVQGSIDSKLNTTKLRIVSGSFQGRDLATLYVFGPFANAKAHPQIPQLVGYPTGYNVTSLAVQHTTVAATIRFEIWYQVLQTSFPFDISGWFLFNDAGQVAQFDMTFRRWSYAMESIVP